MSCCKAFHEDGRELPHYKVISTPVIVLEPRSGIGSFQQTRTQNYACNEINLKHYFPLVYSVTTSLRFGLDSSPSSRDNNVYMQQLVRAVRLNLLSVGHHFDDGLLASPKHVEV
jgi:hypothetical protein